MVKQSNKSMSRFVIENMLQTERDFSNAYKKGKQDWGIQFPCWIYGELIFIPKNSDCLKAVIEFLRYHYWFHIECIKE